MSKWVGAFEADRSNGRWWVADGFLDHDGHGALREKHRYEHAYAVEVECETCGESTWVPAPIWLAHGVAA